MNDHDGFVFREEVYTETAARNVLAYLLDIFHPDSILDLGCGVGTWLKAGMDLGVQDVFGVDKYGIQDRSQRIDEQFLLEADLCRPLDLQRGFDLVLCLEVAEHLPATAAETLVQSIVRHGDLVLFSAALPGQGGQGHLNEQPFQYWQALFENHGYTCYDGLRQTFWRHPEVEYWYAQNMFIYAKEDLSSYGFSPFRGNTYIHPDLFGEYAAHVENVLKQKSENESRLAELADKLARCQAAKRERESPLYPLKRLWWWLNKNVLHR